VDIQTTNLIITTEILIIRLFLHWIPLLSAILKYIGLEGFQDYVGDGNNITNSKPDPEVFIKGALFLGLECGECYVVEDAKAGVDAGKAGGFTTIALGDAYGYENANYSIKQFSEILRIAE